MRRNVRSGDCQSTDTEVVRLRRPSTLCLRSLAAIRIDPGCHRSHLNGRGKSYHLQRTEHMRTMLNSSFLKSVLASFLISACISVQASAKDLLTTATDAGQFNTWIMAIERAGLTSTLKREGPFTVFAPTDAAFEKVPTDLLEKLLTNKDILAKMLTYHVVSGEATADDIAAVRTATSVESSELTFDASNGAKVDAADIVATDVKASNGVIHVINSVLMPESVIEELGTNRHDSHRLRSLRFNRTEGS